MAENVTVIINDVPYTAAVDERGIAVITTDVLDYGNYTVNATYAGDKNFTKDYDIYEFTTNQTDDYLINVTASDINVSDNTNITVNVPSDATGKVIIELNGTNYTATISDGKAILDNVSTLKEGVYNVTAYFGDEKYVNKTVQTRFAVSKVDTPIAITVVNDTNILVGDTVKVVVTVPEDATEDVTIEINGMEFTNSTVDGNATFYIPEITFGNKTVVATYPGDDKYRFNSTTAKFSVNKRDVSDMIVDVTEAIDVGDVAVVNVTLPENATGQVIVKVDGQNYTINLTDGKGSVEIKGLLNGTYPVEVIYPGDDQYSSISNNTQEIKVNKVPSTVTVEVDNITVGDVAAVNITVITNATGNVTIRIGDEYEKTVGVTDGVISVIVPGLTAGDKTVNVTYNGDDRFLPSENSTTFTVSKVETGDLKVIDQGNGTVVVVVSDNATGTVEIKVGNNTYNATVKDGIATIDLVNETPGVHELEVTYSGDENHTAANTTGNATIPKLETPIDVTVENIKVGDKETVVVSVPENATGNVTIEIDGVKYTEEIKDGRATFEIENLTYGNKTVCVDYAGDDNYIGNHTSANFTVDKRESSVGVEVDAIDVGEDAVITVSVPENATGYVIVEIDNQTYAIKVNNGTGSATIKGLASGDHPINVTYLGDDQYFNSTNATSLKVSKVPSSINVTVDDITVGENAVINIEVPEDLCGNVTVSVDGENYTVPVSGGKGTLVVPDLKEGDHTVDVTFDGCKKYEPAENSTTFTVSKVETGDLNVIDLGNGTVVVVVSDNATGTVEIKVGNNTYNATVKDGIATIDLVNETPGTYDIEVTYSGDESHTATNATGTATIPKLETPIDVTVENTKVRDK